jgi:transcriptional regulator with XRE-family HTH domain
MTDLVSKLIDARKAQSLSVYELAKRIGVQRILLSKWEQGLAIPSLANATRWANALNLNLDLKTMYTFNATPPRIHIQLLDAAILNTADAQRIMGVLYRNEAPYSVVVRTEGGIICHLNARVLKPMAPEQLAAIPPEYRVK